MADGNNGVTQHPFMGTGTDDNSLFDFDGFTSSRDYNPMPDYHSPTEVLNSVFSDADATVRGPGGLGGNAFPNQGLYPIQQPQEQYPLGPLHGYARANQTPAGQDASSYGMSAGPPNGEQLSMYPNMPYGNGQGFVSPSELGNLGNGYVPVQIPMQMPAQGYLPAPAADPYHVFLNQPVLLPQPSEVPRGQRIITHNRNQRKENRNDPSEFYPKPYPLGPWGPVVGAKSPHSLFEYYRSTAELKPLVTFSKDQLLAFFRGEGHPNPNRRLTLWIQNTAAQSNDRYAAGPSSSKCRFEGCQGGQKTIMKGFYRLAFDEFSDKTGGELDPLHNAGYMHMHCFETVFDLGYLIHHGARRQGFLIRPDTRHFPFESRNPAAITRDHITMCTAYNNWVKEQKARADLIEAENVLKDEAEWYTGFELQAVPPHAERLGCKLTEHHLGLEVRGRAATRDKRGGVHIGIHKGDLDLYNQLNHAKQRKSPQRKAAEVGDEEYAEEQADEDEKMEETVTQGTKSHPAPQTRKRKQTPEAEPTTRVTRNTKRAKHTHNTTTMDTITGVPAPATDTGNDVAMFDNDIYNASPPRDIVSRFLVPASLHPQQQQQQPAYIWQPQQPPTLPFFNGQLPFCQQQPQQQALPFRPAAGDPRGPRTRKRSRDVGDSIICAVAGGQARLTRSGARQLKKRLVTEPQYVQDQVLAAVPKYVLPVMRDDRLEERVGRLNKRQRRELDELTLKMESGSKPGKRFHSF